jgi:2-C-methyl-D-erythritol 2,4-cyclodiphosphate synthase
MLFFTPYAMRDRMRENIARILEIEPDQIGITATTGEGLTDCGCGDGVQAITIVTTEEDS